MGLNSILGMSLTVVEALLPVARHFDKMLMGRGVSLSRLSPETKMADGGWRMADQTDSQVNDFAEIPAFSVASVIRYPLSVQLGIDAG